MGAERSHGYSGDREKGATTETNSQLEPYVGRVEVRERHYKAVVYLRADAFAGEPIGVCPHEHWTVFEAALCLVQLFRAAGATEEECRRVLDGALAFVDAQKERGA